MMVKLVTQSFGNETEYHRALFTIYSFYANYSTQDVDTILFTDNEEWFSRRLPHLPVRYVHLSPEKIRKMRGQIDFLHRMKIALIEESFLLYPGYNLLYVDSDTFFIANPKTLMDEIVNGNVFMHLKEFEFEEVRHETGAVGDTFSDYLRLMESTPFRTSRGAEVFTARHASWNAGVLGLPAFSLQDIPDVYAITDQSYPATGNHASEQFAFSLILQTRYGLRSCDEYVYHYWYRTKKRIMDDFIPRICNDAFYQLPLDKKLNTVHTWTNKLPIYLDGHVYTLMDNAIQAFNKNEFGKGYRWTVTALLKGAVKELQFLKDVAYHTKRMLKNRTRP
jgi:hypothetical protein